MSAFLIGRLPLLLLILLCSLSARATADLLAGLESFEDPAGTLQIEDVRVATFVPRTMPVVEGFSRGTHWFRVHVRADAEGAPVHLRVGPNFLDDVVLYAEDPARPGAWRTQTLGDRHPFLERTVFSIVPTFLVQPRGEEETYYIRVRSSSTILLVAEALTPMDAAASDIRLHAVTLALALAMLTMLAWALGMWVDDRDPALIAFVVVQLVYSLQVVVIGGFLLPLAPPDMPQFADMSLNVLTVLASFSLLFLNRVLLRPCGLPRWGGLFIDAGLFVLLPVTLILLAAGQARLALQLAAVSMFLIVLVSPVLVLVARDEPPPGRRILFAVLLLQGLVMIASRLVVIGVLAGPFSSFSGIRALGFGQGIISSGLLAVYLLLRQRELRRRAREAESAVREHTARIEAMHVELERRATQAEAGNRAKTAFLAIMGHEFRTPLNAIAGYSEALLRDLAEQRQRGLVERQMVAARALQGMIDDVLDLASASAEGELDRKDFAPALLLADLRERARERAQAQGLSLVLELDPALPASARADPVRIGRVLWHYLDNALKFTRRGSITLVARRLSADDAPLRVRFEVCDTGPGIEAALRERLFTTVSPHEEYLSRQTGGAGLGLALVRQLSIAMGGDAGCESDPGKGSVFWLEVPLEPSQSAVKIVESPQAVSASTTPSPQTQDAALPELAPAIDELAALLAADDIRAIRRFAELEPVLMPALPVEDFRRLRSQVEAFDFESACVTLRAIAPA